MSQQVKILGCGAAGNKACIQLLKDQVTEIGNVMLLNSTMKDIPDEYRNIAIEFGNVRGAGKERDLAKKMIFDSLKNKEVDIDNFISPMDKIAVIVTSSEGGTGSGSSIILAQYLRKVLKMNVHLFVFTGFEDDARSLKNSVDWFSDLSEDITVEAISNKAFMNEAKTRAEAEQLANKEFSKRISILIGNYIIPSEDNMDDTDLYKVSTTPGYMTIEHASIDKLKSTDDFNHILEDMIDNSKSLDTEIGSKRIGIIMNVSKKNRAYIDESFSIIKEKYGQPYELFTHFQETGEDEFVHFIIAGRKLPIDSIKKAYQKYEKQMESIDFNHDSFFGSKEKFNTDAPDGMDMNLSFGNDPKEYEKDAKDFFASFSTAEKDTKKSESHFTNITKNEL